jgi:dolichol-phosphate mannosyltransferase
MENPVNILIPVYNESQTISQTVHEIRRCVKSSYAITVVYDFDEDSTIPVIKNLNRQEGFNIHLLRNELGRGVLNALKTGFKNLNGFIVVVMGDNSDSLSSIDQMIDCANRGYDIVCGSRYMRGGGQTGGPQIKKIFSRAAGISLHYLIGIPTHDITNNFKLYNKEIFNHIAIASIGGFEIAMEIVIKAFCMGYQITEVPAQWKDRQAGKSNFRLWSLLPRYIHWYVFALTSALFSSRKRILKRGKPAEVFATHRIKNSD